MNLLYAGKIELSSVTKAFCCYNAINPLPYQKYPWTVGCYCEINARIYKIHSLENYTDSSFLCLLCMWLMQVTDTDFHPYRRAWRWGWGQEINRAPSLYSAHAYEYWHFWLDGGSLLWNPSPRVVSMWKKKWGTVRLLQRESGTHTGGLSRTQSSAGIFLHLPRILMNNDYLLCFVFGSISLLSTLDKGILRNN